MPSRHRPGISLQHIRRLVTHLRSRNVDAPLRELKFATHGREIYINFPDGSWSGDPVPDQIIFRQAIALDAVAAKIAKAGERDPSYSGQVTSRRGVHRSMPVFEGTRIPVATVQRYIEAGYDTDAIISEYPSLNPGGCQCRAALCCAALTNQAGVEAARIGGRHPQSGAQPLTDWISRTGTVRFAMLGFRPPAPGTGWQRLLPAASFPAGGPAVLNSSAVPAVQQASQSMLTCTAYDPGAVNVTPQSIDWPTPTFFICCGV